MHGGNQKFEAKLDSFFQDEAKTTGREQVDITGLIGQYAHGNEPSHHMAYLYDFVGKPYKTQQLVRKIMKNFYKNAPDGLIGNEDCGQMSAWFVFSSLGFYPMNPCGGEYQVGVPNFKAFSIENYPPKFRISNFDITNNCLKVATCILNDGDTLCSFNDENPLFIYPKEITVKDSIFYSFEMGRGISEIDREKFIATAGRNFIGAGNEIVPIPHVSKGLKLFRDKQFIELSSDSIYYTKDGCDPRLSGIKYTEPIVLENSTVISFVEKSWYSQIEDIFPEYSKIATAFFKKLDGERTIKLKNLPSPQYSGGSEDALVDGEKGTEQWQLGGWQGFEGIDLEAIIDLKKETSFRKLSVYCVEDQNAWIFVPSELRFYTSDDGVIFTELGVQKPDFKSNTEGSHVRNLGVVKNGKARYIKVVAKPVNPIPDWHKGRGGKGWIFATEIVIQ